MSKKILCLGNNSEDTHNQVTKLAHDFNTVNHGLINTFGFVPAEDGYYHTTVVDLPVGEIIELSQHFDTLIMLDQPYEQWSSEKLLFTTYKLFKSLSEIGRSVDFANNQNIRGFVTTNTLLTENKSFCIYPWINFVDGEDGIHLCQRSGTRIRNAQWQGNEERAKIKTKMLAGERVPEHCQVCYRYEDLGVESYRQFETQEWLNRLQVSTVEDLEKIDRPYYYELRLSNKCNLMCRGCEPKYSHLIEQEAKKFHILTSAGRNPKKYASIDSIDIPTLTPKSRVYLTGGDPTVIPEVFTFMERCINAGKTDFEFTVSTNAQKISKRLLNLCSHFSSLNFSISIDGYGKVNDYWRWGSEWHKVTNNAKMLQRQGHSISINTVPGIYNVTNLHLLYEYLDQEFPHTTIYLQLNYNPHQSPYNHPNVELALHSLERCMQTNIYHSNGKSNKTGIDSMYNHYKSNPKFNPQDLAKFFETNDRLDHARGSKLGDYIPELEAVRHLVDK